MKTITVYSNNDKTCTEYLDNGTGILRGVDRITEYSEYADKTSVTDFKNGLIVKCVETNTEGYQDITFNEHLTNTDHLAFSYHLNPENELTTYRSIYYQEDKNSFFGIKKIYDMDMHFRDGNLFKESFIRDNRFYMVKYENSRIKSVYIQLTNKHSVEMSTESYQYAPNGNLRDVNLTFRHQLYKINYNRAQNKTTVYSYNKKIQHVEFSGLVTDANVFEMMRFGMGSELLNSVDVNDILVKDYQIDLIGRDLCNQ